MKRYKEILLLVTLLLLGRTMSVLAAQELQAGLIKQIDDYFTHLEEAGFSGAVLIAKDKEIILQEGYGLASDSKNVPVAADTMFDIGSISKQFTAAAILYLEQQGLLSVEDPISKYFENVPPDKADITIHQLLTHSAGFTQDHFEGDLTPLYKEEALQSIFKMPLGFEPGTKYSYSNTGYTLLAAIVEKVTGRSFTVFMHEVFFDPLGMENTGFYNDPWDDGHAANAYLNGIDQGIPSEWDGPYWGVMGNGGVLSTVGDLYLWWNSLQAHTILSGAQTEKLFYRHISEGASDSYYGYGWSIQDSPNGTLVTHNGGGIGGNSDVALYTDQGVVIIICSNRITWKTLLDTVPVEIRLPATEAREQLAENITSGNFSKLPGPTFLLVPYLAGLIAVFVLIGTAAKLLYDQRKRKTHGPH